MDRLVDVNRDAEVMRFITGRPSAIDETAVELEVALGTRWLAFARENGGSSAGAARSALTGHEYEIGRQFKRVDGGTATRWRRPEELLSYLFFHPEFVDGAIPLGQNDGRRSLDSAGRVRWRFTGESAATA